MTKLSLSFIANQDHLNLLRPYRERRAGIEEVRYEVDIAKLPRHILQLAAAYLDEDAWIALKRQTTSQEQSIQEKEVFCNWLSYYADILRFQDIDSFAQSPAQRRKWFGNHPNLISAIAAGELPLNPKRHIEDSWQLLQTTAEEGANRKNAPPPGFVAVLLLLGTEWKSGVKQVQRVVCGLPALMHIETGKLAPSDDAFCLNYKHLSSEDRDARAPRIGNLQVAGVMPSDAVKVENEGYEGDTAATRSWTTHWDHLNNLFKQFQDKSTAQSFQTFSWPSPIGLNNLTFLGAVAYTAVPVANRRLIALTEDVQFGNAPPLLLKNFIDADARQRYAKPSISWNSAELANSRCLHAGHMGGDYGLDETQRRALWQAVDANDGDIVGVSGPPGTGKTSMLQGDIGTLVVLAALKQSPTVIIAASQTNQATTNMINAFSTIAKPYEPGRAVSIEHRWIDGFPSYGWYFPSASKRGGKDSAYQELFRGTMYDPALLAGGRSLNEDESPRSVSIVTKEVMQTHRMTFNERFTQYLKQKNQDPSLIEATASAYLHRRIKELVGDNSELRRALRDAETMFTILSRHSISDMVSAARDLNQLNNRIPPKNRATQLAQLRERQTNRLQVIDRVKKMYLMQSRSTKKPLQKILLRVLSVFKKPPQREYQQLQHDVSVVDLSIIMPEHVEAFPDYAPLVIDKLCRQVDQQRNQIIKIERWQRRREHLCLAIDSQKKDVELIAKLHETLNRHVALIAQLFDTHRSTKLHAIFKAGLGTENADEDTIKHPVYQLGLQIYQSLCEAGPANPGKLLSLRQQLECVIDITVRYEAFHMAMRYWESRWIEDASTPLAEDPQLEVRMALERAAMLAPVIVATTQTLPALALYLDQNGMPQHRMEIADWLVMDESGQVPPQLSIPLTALARKALAVGDVQQLEPVVTVDQRSNQDLRRRHGLGDTSSQHQRKSLDAVHGNFMACAQYAASRHDNAARGNYGVMLKYHYRCRKTIIEFCNRLVYDAIDPLVPMIPDAAYFARTPNEATQQEALLPPMGFVAVEGEQFALEASQSNQEEVNAIIGWLKENRTAIKQRYGSVEKAVAVIAPYGAQVNKLKEALSASGFKVRQHDSDELVDEALIDQDNTDEMVVGTVHSLQGAEKEIVLFSTVNDPTGKIFIDRKASMLNVAVSRAKHAFIVFGHPGVILKPSGSYSGILAAYLLQFGYRLYPRDLYILESQTKTQLVEQAFGKIAQGIATRGHLREFDVSDNGTPRWRNRSNAESFLAQLQQFIRLGHQHYDHIYLATDDDREGEAIAWHVMELAKQLSNDIPNERYRRLRFYAMTPAALVEGKQFVTCGIDPMRVKAAIARAMADKFIAIEIQEQAHVTAGRVSAGLLDEIERIQQQNSVASYIDTVVVSTARKEPIMLTRLAENDPLGDPAIFANPDDCPINKQIEGDLILAEVMIERVGPLLRTEDAAPATSTAQVLHRAIHDLNLSPMEVMDALQEIYSGSSILEESEVEDIL